MGYDVTMDIQNVVIPGAKVAGALAALKGMMDDVDLCGSGGAWKGGKKTSSNYSWVRTNVVLECIERGDLAGALNEWRYDAEGEPLSPTEQLAKGSEHADVKITYFSCSKWGDDEQLWAVLAPFIADGGVVEIMGEDDHRWRYLFDGGTMKEETGHVVWE